MMKQVVSKEEAKEKGLKHYFTGVACKNGHVAERYVSVGKCVVCQKEIVKRDYEKHQEDRRAQKREYYANNKEKIADYQKQYKTNNPEYKANYHKGYYEKNRDALLEDKRKYYQDKKDVLIIRNKEWRKANPEHIFIRNTLRRLQTNWKGGRARAEEILGYTCEQLRSHIESQFKEGMSWENRSEWHFDHIKPVKAFLDEGITDPAVVNALDNLQPLWAHENLSKNAKWEEEQ